VEHEDWGGGSVVVVEETVGRRTGKAGGSFGLDGRRCAVDDEEPALGLVEGVPSNRRQVAGGFDNKSESSSFIWLSSRTEPSLSIGVETIDKQPT